MLGKELENRQFQDIIEEVVAELKNRLPRSAAIDEKQRRAMVIGTLPKDEETALSSLYKWVPFASEEDWDILVIGSISPVQMAQLALGIAADEQAECILNGLLEGKKIYLLKSGLHYRSYKNTAYKPLYFLYQDYEETLGRLGIERITHVYELAKQKGISIINNTCDYIDLRGIHLLKENDLRKAKKAGCGMVLLDAKTIITPLAMDFITNHSLAVKRQ